MLGRVRKPSGNRNGLRQGDVAVPVKFSGFSNLPPDGEERFLELLGIDGDFRVLQDFGVGRFQRLGEFRKGLSRGRKVAHPTQGNVAVGLDGDGLIEFRRQREGQLQGVARIYPVTPVSFVKAGASFKGVRLRGIAAGAGWNAASRVGR